MDIFSQDNNNENVNRHSPTDHEIIEIKDDPESIAFGVYSTLLAYEDHYNSIQNKYKSLAITWMIAAFVGIGYVISGFEKALNINVFLIILFISLLTAQGIFLLWFLDAGVYHRLIESIWQEVYKIENKYPEMGQSHHLLIKLHNDVIDPEKFHGIFYAYFVLCLLITGLGSLGLYLYFIHKWLSAITVILLTLLSIGIHYLIKHPPFKSKYKD
jgi:hypothetical protein